MEKKRLTKGIKEGKKKKKNQAETEAKVEESQRSRLFAANSDFSRHCRFVRLENVPKGEVLSASSQR